MFLLRVKYVSTDIVPARAGGLRGNHLSLYLYFANPAQSVSVHFARALCSRRAEPDEGVN